eukprot:2053907-Prymnesium_polylepis.1
MRQPTVSLEMISVVEYRLSYVVRVPASSLALAKSSSILHRIGLDQSGSHRARICARSCACAAASGGRRPGRRRTSDGVGRASCRGPALIQSAPARRRESRSHSCSRATSRVHPPAARLLLLCTDHTFASRRQARRPGSRS